MGFIKKIGKKVGDFIYDTLEDAGSFVGWYTDFFGFNQEGNGLLLDGVDGAGTQPPAIYINAKKGGILYRLLDGLGLLTASNNPEDGKEGGKIYALLDGPEGDGKRLPITLGWLKRKPEEAVQPQAPGNGYPAIGYPTNSFLHDPLTVGRAYTKRK